MTERDIKSESDVAALKDVAVAWLEEAKAQSITVINIVPVSTVADYFIIASGNSQVHLNAMAEHVCTSWSRLRQGRARVEGRGSEWVLIDMGFLVFHLMSPRARSFYDLEGLWAPELWRVSSG